MSMSYGLLYLNVFIKINFSLPIQFMLRKKAKDEAENQRLERKRNLDDRKWVLAEGEVQPIKNKPRRFRCTYDQKAGRDGVSSKEESNRRQFGRKADLQDSKSDDENDEEHISDTRMANYFSHHKKGEGQNNAKRKKRKDKAKDRFSVRYGGKKRGRFF